MNMRQQFVKTVESQLALNDKLVLLLGDIGVFGFRNAFKQFPDRVFNIGILEQATVSLAAGLAKTGLIPIVHTIAPFLIERSLEQIKIDFGYQHLGGNFVSVGASYDYAALGCTHHCPADAGLLQNIPGMEIALPGTCAEFDTLFQESYGNGQATYYRLSERENSSSQPVKFGQAAILKKGALATVIAVGPVLDHVLPAIGGLDVSVIYYTTIAPFDGQTLRENLAPSGKVLLIEPFYSGTLAWEVCQAARPKLITIDSVGVPREFLNHYGQAHEHDEAIGLTSKNIRGRLEVLING
ncbi:MAG: transketolase C-terminal domain-containing protein [Candidatus Omnitrophota bacterium]|jgi:transketolase